MTRKLTPAQKHRINNWAVTVFGLTLFLGPALTLLLPYLFTVVTGNKSGGFFLMKAMALVTMSVIGVGIAIVIVWSVIEALKKRPTLR